MNTTTEDDPQMTDVQDDAKPIHKRPMLVEHDGKMPAGCRTETMQANRQYTHKNHDKIGARCP